MFEYGSTNFNTNDRKSTAQSSGSSLALNCIDKVGKSWVSERAWKLWMELIELGCME